jgi:hypothetical protein
MSGIRGSRILFALGAATLVAATASALAYATHPGPKLIGGSSAERRALARVLRSLHVNSGRVEIARGPRLRTGYRGHRKTLTFAGRADPQSQWKDELASGVYEALGFQAAWVEIPGLGAGTFHLSWGGRSMTKREFVQGLRREAREAGARIDQVEFLRPLRLAALVSLTVPDMPGFIRRGGLRLAWTYDKSHRARLEGIFLIVRSPGGRVISRGGTAFRIGAGSGSWPGSEHG